MKSYLQRLAARAEGVALTPSLVPTGRSDTIPPPDTDSSFTKAEHVAGPTEAQSRSAPIVSSLATGQSVQPTPSRPRPRRTSTLREEAAEDAFGAETVLVQPKIPVREALSSQSEAIHPSESKQDRQTPDGIVTMTSPIEDTRGDTNARSLLTSFLGPNSSEEPAAAKNRSPVVIASKEPEAPLAPRLMETPPVRIPAEPRLVIGQLRVDVVAAAPQQMREVVRVVSRAKGSNNHARAAGLTSKLRFGLGQM